ncbi:tannase/feruloyl esterase family alpha/beta hydrolase [Celerinatantimonas sp. YJH-8]|uniref:tannase/feruloyl esterase family alpha/beta hydrolase n=1 Tax=Celerinatantimonas sp. YJH-8 TaxID=3228714 RepID=UPI0038C322FF
MKLYFSQGIEQLPKKVLILLSGLLVIPTASATMAEQCQQLKGKSVLNGVITDAHWVKEGLSKLDPQRLMTGAPNRQFKLPSHCLISGYVSKRMGENQKLYALRYQLRLPRHWNQKFIFQGGGGNDGFITGAFGTIPLYGSTALPALSRNYAVVSMNGGHDGLGAEFGLDQQARLDYAYAAIGKVTQTAKLIIRQYYQHPPKHSFFMGCSNGGREAMIAAQRYPTEFDGVVAANPGFNLSHASIAEVWDTQALYKIAPKDIQGRKILANALIPSDLKLLKNSILAQCDQLDGVKDGIINAYNRCHYDPTILECHSGQTTHCLSSEKVAALKQIFNGAKDPRSGKPLYSDWPYDAGVDTDGWRMWKLGFSQDALHPDSFNEAMGMKSVQYYFMTPPAPNVSLQQFSFTTDTPEIRETSALNDATSTMLSTFSHRGKLIIIQGISDPVFSANDIKKWYEKTKEDTSNGNLKALQQWSRLFMVPGMNHCGGGPALDNIDPLTALENWVEKSKAPDYLAAKGKAFPGKEQPLCPYPQTTQYNGSGNINDIHSYHCQ